jgi:hypothetical protein
VSTPAGDAERRALRVLRIAGTAVLVLYVALLRVFPATPVDANVPGFTNAVVGFELASTPEHVFGILGRPGDPARADAVRRMDRGNWIDLLFLVAYPALYVGIALLLGAHDRAPRPAVILMIVLAGLMAVGDALENRELLFLSGATDPQAMAPALARLRAFTAVKWFALYAASGIAAVFVWRESGWWRWSAPFFGLAALLGAVSIVHLPGIEYGTVPLGVAWIMSYARGWTSR